MDKISSKDRILTTARTLFFEKGFEHVTTDLLARKAAVSKATIYRHFENMLDILDHVATAEADKFRTGLPRAIGSREDLEAALNAFGHDLLTFLNLKETLDFSCLIHEEARTNPQLGQTFYSAAVDRVRGDLGTLFETARTRGVLTDRFDTLEIAEDFLALLQGFGMVRVQLRVSRYAFDDIDGRVRRAVKTIMATHAVDG